MNLIKRILRKEKTYRLKAHDALMINVDELPTQYSDVISKLRSSGSVLTTYPILVLPSSYKKFNSKKYKIPMDRFEAIEIYLYNPPNEEYTDENKRDFILFMYRSANPRINDYLANQNRPKPFNIQVVKVAGGNINNFDAEVKRDITKVHPNLSAYIQRFRSGLSIKNLCNLEIRIVTLFAPVNSNNIKLITIKNGATLNPI